MRRRAFVFFVFATIAGFLFALERGWFMGPIDLARVGVSAFVRPIAESTERIAHAFLSILRVSQLSERVRSLEEALAAATTEASRLQSTARENEELRAALQLSRRAAGIIVAAEVLGPATDGVSGAFRINRGMRHGIRRDHAVLSTVGTVIGRVSETLELTATVDPIVGGEVLIAARDVNTGAEGVVRGLRGLDVIIEAVPRTDTIRAGDRLVTTGLDGVFPPHLFIGTISAVRSPEHAVFQEASVQLPLNIHRLGIVGVITARE